MAIKKWPVSWLEKKSFENFDMSFETRVIILKFLYILRYKVKK